MNYIPDPTEISESKMERLADDYVDEYTCYSCHKKVDYELYYMQPIGDGPGVCGECAGITEDG